jgi:hydroxyethylthiazole kinase-like uncharacterized protein yjeF
MSDVLVTPAVLRRWRLPTPGESKEARGRVLVVGGARETPGAVILAALAALRTGAGKLQIAVGESSAAHVAVAVPEALVRALPERDDGTLDPAGAKNVADLAAKAQAVLAGPGLSDPVASAAFVADLLPHVGEATVVLDALGLAALPDAQVPGAAVLTPNRSEIAHLLDREVDDLRAAAQDAARLTGAVVAVGATDTVIATPDGEVWLDQEGSAGLATSGSGDVLAGVVAGLAARGASPAQAAVWATHVHGRAGLRLAARVGPLGFLARELLAEVPAVLLELET